MVARSPSKRTAVDILRAVMVLGASSMTVSALGLFKNILAAYFFGTSLANRSRTSFPFLVSIVAVYSLVVSINISGGSVYLIFPPSVFKYYQKGRWDIY